MYNTFITTTSPPRVSPSPHPNNICRLGRPPRLASIHGEPTAPPPPHRLLRCGNLQRARHSRHPFPPRRHKRLRQTATAPSPTVKHPRPRRRNHTHPRLGPPARIHRRTYQRPRRQQRHGFLRYPCRALGLGRQIVSGVLSRRAGPGPRIPVMIQGSSRSEWWFWSSSFFAVGWYRL